MKKKVINNELAMLKIANYESIIFHTLIKSYFFLQEIYNAIGLIEKGVIGKEMLVDKDYEGFAVAFDREYSEYVTILKNNKLDYKALLKLKRIRVAKRAEVEAIVSNASISKNFINRVIEKRLLLKRSLPATVLFCRKYIQGLKDKLVVDNRYLVVNIAQSLGVKEFLEDVIHVGVQGLVKATNVFNPLRKIKFSTYAFYWIQLFVREGIMSHGGDIKIPVYLQKQMRKLDIAYNSFLSECRREPTAEELSGLSGVSSNMMDEIKRVRKIKVDSIYKKVGRDENTQLVDLIDDGKEEDRTVEFVQMGLSKLDGLEANVIIDMYGINNMPILTNDEIAAKYKIPPKRLRVIRKEAMAKLKVLLS